MKRAIGQAIPTPEKINLSYTGPFGFPLGAWIPTPEKINLSYTR